MLFTGLPRATDTSGKPIAGAKWYFYATGTTTPQTAYADDAFTVPLPNPVIADLYGQFPNIFLDQSLIYRCRLTDASDVPLMADIDPFSPDIPVVSTYSKSLLVAPDAPTVLNTLGVSTFVQTLLASASAQDLRNTIAAVTMTASDTNLGYANFSVGVNTLQMRWGTGYHSDNTGGQFVTFMVPFDHAGFWGTCSNFTGSSSPPLAFHGNVTPVKTGMQCYSSTASGVAAPSGTQFNWLALGW